MRAEEMMTIGKLLDAPCIFCGYNGAGYWQVTTHDKKCPFHALGGIEERQENLREIIRSKATQAEISFKAGYQEGVEDFTECAKYIEKGRREVMEWLKQHNDFNECGVHSRQRGLLLTTETWQAKLNEVRDGS